MFKEVPPQFDFPAAEKEVLDFWKDRGIYQKSLDQREGAEPFVFFEGPPTANGMPHPGHCLTRVIKDLFPRYRTMCGYFCERKAGWDTHGLPVEVEVCKELGIHSKEEIEAYGMEPFIHKCQQSVFRYMREWEQLTERLGFWANLDEAYVTFHQTYIESVWWALKTFYDAGLLYQGHKIVWWWAQGGTALSAGEVGQGYREVDDPSVYVRFPLADEDASLLVWTTTPWTLLSNTFVAVHENLSYDLVRDPQRNLSYYVASDLRQTLAQKTLTAVKGEEAPTLEVVRTVRGSELVGRRYQPPFDFYSRERWDRTAPLVDGGEEAIAWRVVAADFVTTDSGTGLVHEAPAFGEIDYELFLAEQKRFQDPNALELFCAVGPNGEFTSEAGERYEGRWVKEADKDVARELKDSGLLLHQEQYRHDYPFCWRAEQDPLIQYPRKSWFVRTTQFVDDLVANNQQIQWRPEHIRDGRFGKFLEGNVDWTLSRERYWGTPLPIWQCDRTGQQEAIGSYSELCEKKDVQGLDVWTAAKAENPELSEDLKVHRPYIDAVTYASPFDGEGRMQRVSEVIDCWFDSGAMPFAQWGYPHQNRERFEAQYPAQFISEALDQTRGWFYSLLALGTLLFGENGVARKLGIVGDSVKSTWPLPFENCIVLGLIKGEDGLKMSKSKRNYRTPDYIFDNHGADAMRWLFLYSNPPWTSIMFQDKAIAEGQREFLIRLYNVYSFFVIYANLDGWKPSDDLAYLPAEGTSELDRWLIGELQKTTQSVRECLDRYESYPAARALSDFVDSLSNWYVRRSRERFWRTGMDTDKEAAYQTLYAALVQTALLAAPFVPFFAESMYQNLVRSRDDGASFPESIHLCDYPEVVAERIDPVLSRSIALTREVASLGRSVRAQNSLKVRLPLSLAIVVVADPQRCDELRGNVDLIASELNVKEVQFTSDADEYVRYQVKPNFRSIGPKYGKQAPAIQKALGSYPDPAELRRRLETEAEVQIEVDGAPVALTADDVQIALEAREGWAAAQGREVVVVINCEVTEELRREGMARDLIHHVQTLRKELDLAYEDRIRLSVTGAEPVLEVVREFSETITRETLVSELAEEGILDGDGNAVAPKCVSIEGHDVELAAVVDRR